MKSILTLLLAALMTAFSSAQSQKDIMKDAMKTGNHQASKEVSDNGGYFYKSYSDYVNDKKVDGVRYTGNWKMIAGGESVDVTMSGKEDHLGVSKFDYWGVTDEHGQLMRIYDKSFYYVTLQGKLFCYIKKREASLTPMPDGSVSLSAYGGYLDYVSKGDDGEIKEATNKYLEELFADKPGLYDKYKGEKINKMRDDVRDDMTLKVWKYVKMYNGDEADGKQK